jgi:hypothetical protein
MKKSVCWLVISVLTLSLAGCNHGWPGLFCRHRVCAEQEAYDECEPCAPCASGYAPATSGPVTSGTEWRVVPSPGTVETLPGPATTTAPATR